MPHSLRRAAASLHKNKSRIFRCGFCHHGSINFNVQCHNYGMSKSKKTQKPLYKLSSSTVSANELTGSLQKISLDPEEVRRFHDEYVGDD